LYNQALLNEIIVLSKLSSKELLITRFSDTNIVNKFDEKKCFAYLIFRNKVVLGTKTLTF